MYTNLLLYYFNITNKIPLNILFTILTNSYYYSIFEKACNPNQC